MKHIVLFSGGVQSSYVAWMITQQFSNVTLLFHDTKTEPDDNYRFRHAVAEHIGIGITEQSDGRNIWEVFNDEHFLGNNRVPMCSRILKSRQGEIFYKGLNEDFIVHFGFGINEYRRAQKVMARNPKMSLSFPLIDRRIRNDGIRNIIMNEWGICLPAMYQWFKHANCVPCVRWGQKDWAKCHTYYPKEYQRAQEAEVSFGHSIMQKQSLIEFASEISANTQQTFPDSVSLPCICAT